VKTFYFVSLLYIYQIKNLLTVLYADLRERLFNEVKRSNVHFIILSDDDKFIYLFKSTECYDMVAKTCFNILSRRNSFLYS
jgi:hypothetical protein